MATLPEVKPGDAITARWANAITQICRRVLRITVAPPLQAHIGPSGIHLSLASQPAGVNLVQFVIVATPDAAPWIDDEVEQTDDLRAGILRRGGKVYATRREWDPDFNDGEGRWFALSSTEQNTFLVYDGLFGVFAGRGDLLWCFESTESKRWEIVSGTRF